MRASDNLDAYFLENFSQVPEPTVPLLETGQKVYQEFCRALIKGDNLTLKTREYVELLAIAKDDIAFAIENGKRPTRQALEAVRAAMMRIEKLQGDAAINAPNKGDSPFAHFGFAKRARQARENG